MNRERIKQLAENPNFISGIYNYCDRWCERCSFTSRCLTYAIDEDKDASDLYDMDNDAFWKKLHETFKFVRELLQEMAEREGIDLDSLDIKAYEEEDAAIKRKAKDNACSKAAKKYAKMVRTWFDSSGPLFEDKAEDLEKKALLDIPDTNPEDEAVCINDFMQVIQWYQNMIYVKLMRSLQQELDEHGECLEEFPRDSDGSAKVALIAMDRSIAAWAGMRGYFPGQEDDILDILIHLDRLRRRTERTFPEARAFVRPGFDD